MKRFTFRVPLTILFLILLIVFFTIANSIKPRVLILHSYALDYAWVREINEGLNWTLGKQPYSIRWHYMDTKRHPDAEFKEKASRLAEKIIREWSPNVVIAIDDNAQIPAKQFINDPRIKIVFSGVNAKAENYGYDTASNVTGVLERLPFSSVKEAFLQILPPERRRIIHFSDSSETSLYIHQEMETFSWNPIQLVESRMVETFDDWKAAIQDAAKKADFLLITHYHTLKRSATDKTVVPPKEVMKWTEQNSAIPGIGCWGFYVDDGGMVAAAVSAYEQGEVAAKLALDIIEKGKQPNQLPVKSTNLYVMYMREARLKAHNIRLPKVYEAFAHATNHYYYN